MTKLKHALAFVFATLVGSASAETIKLISVSPFNGPVGQIVKAMNESVNKIGYDISPNLAGSCAESLYKFENATGPFAILMTDSTARLGKKSNVNCLPDVADKNHVPVIQVGVSYYICSRPGFTLPKDRDITLGWISIYPIESIYSELNNNTTGYKFKYVGFKGSSGVMQGVVNGDVDLGYVAVTVADPAIKAGSIECHYSNKNDGSTKTIADLIGRKDHTLDVLAKPRWIVMVKNIDQNSVDKIKTSLTEAAASLNKQKFSDVKVNLTDQDKQDFWKRNISKSDAK